MLDRTLAGDVRPAVFSVDQVGKDDLRAALWSWRGVHYCCLRYSIVDYASRVDTMFDFLKAKSYTSGAGQASLGASQAFDIPRHRTDVSRRACFAPPPA